MQIIVPAAAHPSEALQQARNALELPALHALLQRSAAPQWIAGDDSSLSPLSEQLHAQALALEGADGLLPWAARAAQSQGLDARAPGWAWITPCHWRVHSDHVYMDDPERLRLTRGDADALLRDMQPFFAADGITLYPTHDADAACVRWLAHGSVLAGLPTASLERVRAASVDAWMPRQAQAKGLRRLQNEMQMLLYTHPVNAARAHAGQLPVNAFWVSGTGTLSGAARADTQPVTLVQTLRSHALSDDAQGWSQAWTALDSGVLADALHSALAATQINAQRQSALSVTLCGPRNAWRLTAQRLDFWQQLRRRLRPLDERALLARLDSA